MSHLTLVFRNSWAAAANSTRSRTMNLFCNRDKLFATRMLWVNVLNVHRWAASSCGLFKSSEIGELVDAQNTVIANSFSFSASNSLVLRHFQRSRPVISRVCCIFTEPIIEVVKNNACAHCVSQLWCQCPTVFSEKRANIVIKNYITQ